MDNFPDTSQYFLKPETPAVHVKNEEHLHKIDKKTDRRMSK